MSSHISTFEEIVLNMEGTALGSMFGKPCGKFSGKAFVSFFQDEMVFKLGKEEIELIKPNYPGAQNWDPSGKGRPMKDWIQIPTDFTDDWQDLAEQAKASLEKELNK